MTQEKFQVRFDWAHKGAAAIGDGAHVLVWCDAISTEVSVPSFDGAILVGTVGNAAQTAAWVLDLQARLGDRAYVAVVAAGTDDGRFAVEDFLAAGAVIDALATVGIDFNSPEAASACAAFEGLRGAIHHLTSASVAGQAVGSEMLAAARARNSEPTVMVLREFVNRS